MTKYKYDTKGHRNTNHTIIADQNDHGLSNNSNNSSLNRKSALRNIDPDMNYLSSNLTLGILMINTLEINSSQIKICQCFT